MVASALEVALDEEDMGRTISCAVAPRTIGRGHSRVFRVTCDGTFLSISPHVSFPVLHLYPSHSLVLLMYFLVIPTILYLSYHGLGCG